MVPNPQSRPFRAIASRRVQEQPLVALRVAWPLAATAECSLPAHGPSTPPGAGPEERMWDISFEVWFAARRAGQGPQVAAMVEVPRANPGPPPVHKNSSRAVRYASARLSSVSRTSRCDEPSRCAVSHVAPRPGHVVEPPARCRIPGRRLARSDRVAPRSGGEGELALTRVGAYTSTATLAVVPACTDFQVPPRAKQRQVGDFLAPRDTVAELPPGASDGVKTVHPHTRQRHGGRAHSDLRAARPRMRPASTIGSLPSQGFGVSRSRLRLLGLFQEPHDCWG